MGASWSPARLLSLAAGSSCRCRLQQATPAPWQQGPGEDGTSEARSEVRRDRKGACGQHRRPANGQGRGLKRRLTCRLQAADSPGGGWMGVGGLPAAGWGWNSGLVEIRLGFGCLYTQSLEGRPTCHSQNGCPSGNGSEV